jgi:hypothetical protein
MRTAMHDPHACTRRHNMLVVLHHTHACTRPINKLVLLHNAPVLVLPLKILLFRCSRRANGGHLP